MELEELKQLYKSIRLGVATEQDKLIFELERAKSCLDPTVFDRMLTREEEDK